MSLGGVAAWIVTHWHPAKVVEPEWADLTQAVGAHLGWGIAPRGPVAGVLMVVGLAGITTATAGVALPSLRSSAGPPEWVVLAGMGIIVLGTVPFARYPYAPLGAGDRYNFVSSVGGALVWTGVLMRLWPRRQVAMALAVVLVAAAGTARLQRSVLWHRAGHDAEAIRTAVVLAFPPPAGRVVLGPRPIQQENIAAYLDQSNVLGSLQLVYDDRAQRAGIAQSQAQWESFPPAERFDIRPWSTLEDDRAPEPDAPICQGAVARGRCG